MIEKTYQYKHLYFAVLAACNQLPEAEDASTIYELTALDATSLTPLNADRYPALEVFRCVLAAEADVLKMKLLALQQGRAAGAIAEGGFIEQQAITAQGGFINSHLGRVINVEVEVAENVFEKGTLETVEQVSRMANPNYPLKLDTATGLYAMDIGEKQLWFIGLSARVSYLTFKQAVIPETMEALIEILAEPIAASDEDASAIIELAVSMVLPTGGHMEGVGAARLQRAIQRLGMPGTNLPDAQLKINAKMGVE